MAFVLKLTDGTNNVDYMASEYRLGDGGLRFNTPQKKQVWSGESVFHNGSQLVYNAFENQEIIIRHQVKAADEDALADAVNKIDQLLETARYRSITQDGPRVELQYKLDSASSMVYFWVIDGDLVWPDDMMSVEQVHQRMDGEMIIYDFETRLICQPFGYPVSPVSGSPTVVGLTNGNGTDVTTGLLVWNHDDAHSGHDNWVEIDGADIAGAYGCRLKLSIKRESGEAEKASKIWVGCRRGSTSFKHILEDNAAEYVIGSPSPTFDEDYSSADYYTSFDFTSTTGEELIRWVLSDTDTGNTRGPFRFLGRTAETYHWDSNANYRIAIKYGSDVIYRSEWRKPVDTTTELFDFGTIYMPPWLIGTSGDLAGLKIAIEGKRDSAGTSTIKLDYLALLPQDGGFRILEMRTTGLAQYEFLVDDGWAEEVYHLTTGSKKTGLPFGLMQRIELKAGNTTRLYFFVEGTSKNAEITRQLKIQAYLVPTFNVVI